jgi:hypothetical protein
MLIDNSKYILVLKKAKPLPETVEFPIAFLKTNNIARSIPVGD